MAEEQGDNWFPLESNPEVMNSYVSGLGFDVSKFSWCDLMSVEDWAIEMVPQPCLALVFLYPITENTRIADEAEDKLEQVVDKDIYFMNQYARNACGTVAVMHAILNLEDKQLVAADSILDKFAKGSAIMTPQQRGNYFLTCNELKTNHQVAVQGGQASMQEDVDTHFIVFIQKNGHIYELDGRKKSPINHGPTTVESFLTDAAALAKKLMERDPDQINFTLVALAKTPEE